MTLNTKDKRGVYSVAALAVKVQCDGECDATLLANVFIAWSHDDARLKATAWLKEHYPASEGFTDYWIKEIEICEAEGVNEFMAALATQAAGPDTYSESAFLSAEPDKLQ